MGLDIGAPIGQPACTMQTFLEDKADLAWLFDVHLGKQWMQHAIVCAIVNGNEDSPDSIELFPVNHVDCKPWKFVRDEINGMNGSNYRQVSEPQPRFRNLALT